MLHTHDPKVADTEEFAKVLRDAKGVWFDGGRQWNIVDSYANTLTYREFHKVLERGGVIGGSSAGATIQGDYLVRGAIAGSEIVMTPEPEHEHGFAFLRKVAIDQHINTRNRWDDIIPVIKKYPNLLGIGLSEGTAIVVTGDRFEVIGKWKVADPRQHARLSALGEALLRAVGRRRLQHEDAHDREVRASARRRSKVGLLADPLKSSTHPLEGSRRGCLSAPGGRRWSWPDTCRDSSGRRRSALRSAGAERWCGRWCPRDR